MNCVYSSTSFNLVSYNESFALDLLSRVYDQLFLLLLSYDELEANLIKHIKEKQKLIYNMPMLQLDDCRVNIFNVNKPISKINIDYEFNNNKSTLIKLSKQIYQHMISNLPNISAKEVHIQMHDKLSKTKFNFKAFPKSLIKIIPTLKSGQTLLLADIVKCHFPEVFI